MGDINGTDEDLQRIIDGINNSSDECLLAVSELALRKCERRCRELERENAELRDKADLLLSERREIFRLLGCEEGDFGALERLRTENAGLREDIECALADDPCLPHRTELGKRVWDRIGRMETELRELREDRDGWKARALSPLWLQEARDE
jgi:hypothetical protein